MKTSLLFIGTQEIIVIIVFVLIFFAFRAVMLWYWKVDVIVANQQKQIDLLTDLLKQKSVNDGNRSYSNEEVLDKARRFDEMNRR